MPDFITRWAVIGLLILAGIATGTVLGARYELARWEAQTSKDQVVIARVKAARTIKTQEINHETNRFIARSDTYWGVRQSGGAGGLPGSTGIANAASTADAPDSEGSTGG